MRSRTLVLLLLLTSGLGTAAVQLRPTGPGPFDLLIRDGRVMDGGGNPWIRADVAIRDGRIAAVGQLAGATTGRVIEAAGRHVTPGFIDVHSHAADGLARQGLGQGQPLLAQGITTIVANPDGGGPVDLAAQRASLEEAGVGVNVALLVGHGSVRQAVLGLEDRAPAADELERMQQLVRRAMREGAFGLSSGLFYAPGSYAAPDEVVALARVAGEFGGVYTSHIRDEGNYGMGLLAAVQEVIDVAEQAEVAGIVTHMKALGPENWGLTVAATMRLDAARARGVPVFADQYPYEASSTSLTGALVPRWALAGGPEELHHRLRTPETRVRLLAELDENIRRRGGPETLVMAHVPHERALEGRSLAEIAASRGRPPGETALDLLARGAPSVISFNMAEPDIIHVMRRPYTMTSSDGGLVFPTEGRPHPRNYGAFARKIARYVRETGTIDFEFAIRSMTGLPALVFGMHERGAVRPGAAADLLVFDPARVRDTATYEDPHRLAEGMDYVIVNGQIVIDDGRFTSALPGVVLRKN